MSWRTWMKLNECSPPQLWLLSVSVYQTVMTHEPWIPSTHCGLVAPPYGDKWSGSKLAQVMAWCLMAPSHYQNQCWLIIRDILWHSPENNFIMSAQANILWNDFKYCSFNITASSSRGQWVNQILFSLLIILNKNHLFQYMGAIWPILCPCTLNPNLLTYLLSMYGWDILCGVSKVPFKIPHKISYPCIERCLDYW